MMLTIDDKGFMPDCQISVYICVRLYWTQNFATNIPNLNPVDYSVWGDMQQYVYQKCVWDVDIIWRSHNSLLATDQPRYVRSGYRRVSATSYYQSKWKI